MDKSPLPPSRRSFSQPDPKKKGGLRDTDAAENVTRLRAFTNGIYGGVLGGLLGLFLGGAIGALVGAAAGWAALSLTVYLLANSAGGAASVLYAPSSGAPPRKKEYSQAESLVARGLYEEAVTAFELAVLEDPGDPTPYLRVARIYRDHLGRYEDSARWMRRALREAAPPPGVAFLARKELVELYTHRLKTPEKALPELARMAHEMEGSPEGEWAAREVRTIKERMVRRLEEGEAPESNPPG